MNTTPDFWWPEDARTHTDADRCGNCGHATAHHHAPADQGPWAPSTAARPCTFRNPDGETCSCRRCTSPKNRK